MGDFTFELLQQFHLAAGQYFFATGVVGSYDGTHVGMTAIEQYSEVWIALASDGVNDLNYFRRFVEDKARLEFPADGHSVICGDLATFVPHADEPIHPGFRANVFAGILKEGRRFDGIDADRLNAEVAGENGESQERRDVRQRALIHDRRAGLVETPQIDGDGGECEAVV